MESVVNKITSELVEKELKASSDLFEFMISRSDIRITFVDKLKSWILPAWKRQLNQKIEHNLRAEMLRQQDKNTKISFPRLGDY